MATAKTPKKIPAAAPAAAKPAIVAKPAPAVRVPAPVVHAKVAKPAAKPAPVRAAAAKAPEEAVVHSAEIVSETVAKAAEATAETVTAAATKTADHAAPQLEKAVEAVKEIADKPSKAVTVVKKAAGEAQDDVLKTVTPFLDFSRDNAILLVSAGNELALGLHKLSLSLIDWSAASCDKSVAAGHAILSATSVEEVIDLSQSLAKDSLEQLFKEGSELSALSSKLIEDTIVPLPGRLVAAVEKLASHTA